MQKDPVKELEPKRVLHPLAMALEYGPGRPHPPIDTAGRDGGDPKMERKHHFGFTLIELLVVIATISGLLAVLSTAVLPAHVLAGRLRCSANLRQLALAWHLYLDDYNGCFYQSGRANVDYGGWRGLKGWWPRPLNPYVGLSEPNSATEDSARLYYCPADRGGKLGARYAHEMAYRVHGTSYQTNIFLIGQDWCGSFSTETAELDQMIARRLPGMTINRVGGHHARLLLMGDHGWINQWQPGFVLSPEDKRKAEWHRKADYHNMAFLDGHVAHTKIVKGLYVGSDACILPFAELFPLAKMIQTPKKHEVPGRVHTAYERSISDHLR